jgi:peptide/nickel transport system permease protein
MALLKFIIRRLIYAVIVLFFVSIASFVVIQLPPGDFLATYIQNIEMTGGKMDQATVEALRASWGLDQPLYVQYFLWFGKLIQGDLGFSFLYQKPVAGLILERLPLTLFITIAGIILVYAIAIPLGILAATRQNSIWDYSASLMAFIGTAVPEFLLALILMWALYQGFGLSIGGLFSPEMRDAPWSLARVLDGLAHLFAPVLILAVTGSAGLVRTMRAGLLDEIRKQYVVTARAKGLPERTVINRYAVRSAINPIISAAAWLLPEAVSGGVILSIVLGLPTVGPMLLQSLQAQDMYLAAGIVMIISALTIIGIILSDIVLALVDPRIRYS